MSGLTDDPDEPPRDWGELYRPAPLPRMTRSVQEVVAEIGRPLTDAERVELLDEAEVMHAIAGGCAMTAVCEELRVSWWTLHHWLTGTTERRQRYEAARRLAATMFEERAEAVLTKAPPTLAELARAKAISSLLAARAKTHDPSLYGDRQQVSVTHDVIAELRDRIHAAGSRLPIAPSLPPMEKVQSAP